MWQIILENAYSTKNLLLLNNDISVYIVKNYISYLFTIFSVDNETKCISNIMYLLTYNEDLRFQGIYAKHFNVKYQIKSVFATVLYY